MRQLLFIIIFFIFSTAHAQEELRSLDFRGVQEQKVKKTGHDSVLITYLFDTLELPFIDDFVRNRNKNMRLNIHDDQVFDSTLALFSVNDSSPESIGLRFDTTFFIIETSPGIFDTLPYLPKEVIFYDSTQNYLPVDTQLFWQVDREIMLGSTTYTEILSPDTILYNQVKVSYYARDDANSYWINEGAFRNNSFGVRPPTVGVMTFDGLDRLGVPYDFSSSTSYGNADYLTSKPINLGVKADLSPFTPNDSVYFSFYYQPQGVGNAPEITDSLSLNFYSPVTEKWYWIWAAAGDSIQNFRRVDFHITDSLFLKKGFQFRFRNKGTLSGSLDHWNIDYVAITQNARVQKQNFADVGYFGETPSYIKTYTSMPWLHFKRNPSKYMVAGVEMPIINLSAEDDRFVRTWYNIRRKGESTTVYSSDPEVIPNLPLKTNLEVTMPIASASPPFSFPTDFNERATFEIQNYIEVTPDENRDNDTLYHYQYFDTYYAYDDGIAELAYSLNGTGARLAYEFETDGTDTLKAVLINFPRMLLNEQNRKISIMVWDDLTKDPIYESGPVWEVSYPDLNDFKRYAIDEMVVVSGKYYIGWEQQDNRKIYVGWDVNKRNESKLFYSLDGLWNQTSFEGSLMFRPDFGYAQINAGTKELARKTESIVVYPNPARNSFSIKSESEVQSLSIFDLRGRELLELNANLNEPIDIDGLESGIYIVQARWFSGETTSTKLQVIND